MKALLIAARPDMTSRTAMRTCTAVGPISRTSLRSKSVSPGAELPGMGRAEVGFA